MRKLYIKQAVFSWPQHFEIRDELGNTVYVVDSKMFSIGRKLTICAPNGIVLANIEQEVFRFLPRYHIIIDGVTVLTMIKRFTMFRDSYTFEGSHYTLEGDYWSHNYRLLEDGRAVMTVNKKWFTWGDTYEMQIFDQIDELLCVAVCIIMDCVNASKNNN